MRKQCKKMFSILELLIVITIMSILALSIFVLTKGVKDSAKTVQTEATISTSKTNVENLYNFIFNQSRSKYMEVYQHTLFSKVWSSNKIWTFRDKDEVDNGITSNGLMDMINIGSLGIENSTIVYDELEYNDGTKSKTLIDGWGNPIFLMRNEMPWFIKRLGPKESVAEKVYQDRTKASLGLYAKYTFNTNYSGKNLYGWNDIDFNHVDSKGVKGPSYEVAPEGANGMRIVDKDKIMYGKVAVPFNNNDFDFFSVGKDGKVGNLRKNDNMQDRWSDIMGKQGGYKWVPVNISSTTDPDTDNIVSFQRYLME